MESNILHDSIHNIFINLDISFSYFITSRTQIFVKSLYNENDYFIFEVNMMKIKIYLSKIIVIILIATSLLILSVNTSSTITASSLIDHKKSSPSIQALVDLVPIEIISDDNFTDYGFTGAGTAADPYVIENYNITTTSYTGILVKGTTKHFVIRFCYIDSAGYGVYFESVTSGTAKILNTTFNENSWEGIYLRDSSSVSIINSTMTKNGEGIHLSHSPGAVFINNTLSDNRMYGINMWYSYNSTLTNNIFYKDGVNIYDTSKTNYLNFSFENNWVNGKILGYYTAIDDLSFTVPDYGQLILVDCKRPIIYNQDLSDTTIGLFLYDCDNADIMNNTCNNNIYGIYLESSTYSTITNNTCNNNFDGIESLYDSHSTFANNTCNYNKEYGLWLFISDDCIVYNNTCNDNYWLGIYIWSCSENTITNNTINSDHWGIYLQSSDTCLITYNLIEFCTQHGIYLDEFSSDNVIHHNHLSYNYLGGFSQGYDAGTTNIWYDIITLEGNWWSDWTGTPTYPLDGEANNFDPYPKGPFVVSEFSTGIQLIFTLSLIGVSAVTLSIITKKRSRN